MVPRDKALAAIRARVQNDNLVKHMLATEAIMKGLAHRLQQDETAWGRAGLLHDIDVEETGGDMSRHSREGAVLARELGASEEMAAAILRHNETHGFPRATLMDKALFCADPLTGLITAVALVRPDKRLAGVEAQSILKRFKEKRFAAGANRGQIALCAELGLGLEEFVTLGLAAMQGIAADLGL